MNKPIISPTETYKTYKNLNHKTKFKKKTKISASGSSKLVDLD